MINIYFRWKERKALTRRKYRHYLKAERENKMYPKVDIDIITNGARMVIKNSGFSTDGVLISDDFIHIICGRYLFQYEAASFRNRKIDITTIPRSKFYQIIDGNIIETKGE